MSRFTNFDLFGEDGSERVPPATLDAIVGTLSDAIAVLATPGEVHESMASMLAGLRTLAEQQAAQIERLSASIDALELRVSWQGQVVSLLGGDVK